MHRHVTISEIDTTCVDVHNVYLRIWKDAQSMNACASQKLIDHSGLNTVLK